MWKSFDQLLEIFKNAKDSAQVPAGIQFYVTPGQCSKQIIFSKTVWPPH